MKDRNVEKQIIEFIKERDWEQFHTPKNLVISIGAEVGELMECFQWKSDDEIIKLINAKDTEDIEDEVADIYTYLVSFCNSMDIDLEAAVKKKLKKNEQKYPIDKSYGNATKYTDL